MSSNQLLATRCLTAAVAILQVCKFSQDHEEVWQPLGRAWPEVVAHAKGGGGDAALRQMPGHHKGGQPEPSRQHDRHGQRIDMPKNAHHKESGGPATCWLCMCKNATTLRMILHLLGRHACL